MSDDVVQADGVSTKGESKPAAKKYSKEELKAFVADVARRVVESNASYMHSMLAINHILRLPNAQELLDDELKEEMRDIWLKLQSMGLQLGEPPLLFGISAVPVSSDEGDDWGEGEPEHEAKPA